MLHLIDAVIFVAYYIVVEMAIVVAYRSLDKAT